jgi:inner membrane protein
MLLLGHLGITIGAASLIEKFIGNSNKDNEKVSIDYRLVMVGSMLPDIIDKPLVLLTASKPVGSARFIAHSLIFIIGIFLLGEIYQVIYKRQGIILIACASLAHMVEDSIWKSPKALFWPWYNWLLTNSKKSLPTMNMQGINKRVEIITESVAKLNMKKILLDPDVFIPEILGGMILLYFFLKLMYNKNLIRFLKTGLITQSHLNTWQES